MFKCLVERKPCFCSLEVSCDHGRMFCIQGDPVTYASRILNNAEQNYSQTERESLAVVFGVTKYRQYMLGRHFKLLTDHKPLITLLREHKSVPLLAAARIKRWALLLAAFDYTIEFIRSKDNVFADFFVQEAY